MFEPTIPQYRYGQLYERWLIYWHGKFEEQSKHREMDADYWFDCRKYIQERWNDSRRKLLGVQSSESLPDLENI